MPDTLKNALEIVSVKWIDQVLERALERKPDPLPEPDVPAAVAKVEEPAAAAAVVTH